MQFIGWMYDVAREQSPNEETLREWLRRSEAAGYNVVGFYLEHRFRYKSAPWAAGEGALAPDVVQRLSSDFKGLRLIPFLNTLGHMEGFVHAEGGQWLAEGESGGSQQMCPSRPECVEFARGLVSDALEAFDDEWVHVGGDETNQLGECDLCKAKADKAQVYADYFAPLCKWVVEQGRRPCLWGDMLIEHPSVLDELPKETVIFDWQYSHSPLETSRMFIEKGFDVVCCPSVHTYDAAWCYLNETCENIDDHATAARELGALGVLVTTWEFSFFTNYLSTIPLIMAAGRRLAKNADWREALVAEGGEGYARAAEILGTEIPNASPFLAPPGWRKLRQTFVLQQNPFNVWKEWREEACGDAGDRVMALCREVRTLTDNIGMHLAADMIVLAVAFVRRVEEAYHLYRQGRPDRAATSLSGVPEMFLQFAESLERLLPTGGSAADPERARLLGQKVSAVCARLRELPRAGFLPSFEVLVHDAYVPGDQAAWRTTWFK